MAVSFFKKKRASLHAARQSPKDHDKLVHHKARKSPVELKGCVYNDVAFLDFSIRLAANSVQGFPLL